MQGSFEGEAPLASVDDTTWLWQKTGPSSRQRECYIRTKTAIVELGKNYWSWISRDLSPRRPIAGKPPVVKYRWLRLSDICLTATNIWSWALDRGFTSRPTGSLTVDGAIMLTLSLDNIQPPSEREEGKARFSAQSVRLHWQADPSSRQWRNLVTLQRTHGYTDGKKAA
jgi:hypothetical protein